eukprot:scaffold277444_cov28-Tisochrysis_lutea.AAC.1
MGGRGSEPTKRNARASADNSSSNLPPRNESMPRRKAPSELARLSKSSAPTAATTRASLVASEMARGTTTGFKAASGATRVGCTPVGGCWEAGCAGSPKQAARAGGSGAGVRPQRLARMRRSRCAVAGATLARRAIASLAHCGVGSLPVDVVK